MSNVGALQANGAPIKNQTHWTPLTTSHWFSGMITQRGYFSGPDSRYYERYFGARTDMLLGGQNVELTNYGTLIRRPGLIPYSTATLPSPITSFYSFRQINGNANPIDVMVDTTTGVYKLTPTQATRIFTKANGAGQTFFQGVGNTLYMGDGVDLLAWSQPGIRSLLTGTRNWGISIGEFSGVSGPNQCATGADIAVGGGSAWTDPNTISTNVSTGGTALILTQVSVSGGSAVYTYSGYTGVAPAIGMTVAFSSFTNAGNNVVAVLTTVSGGSSGTVTVAATTQVNETHLGAGAVTAYVQVGNIPSGSITNSPGAIGGWGSSLPVSINVAPGATSVALTAYNLGFSIPANATITGVQLSTTRQKLSGSSGLYSTNIALTGVTSTPKGDAFGDPWTGTLTPVTYGGSADAWGAVLSPSVINSSAFGITLEAQATGAPGSGANGQITAITITVYYTTPSTNQSDLLEAQQFGFNLTPTTTIQGLQVSIEGCQAASNPPASSLTVQLLANGSPVGTPVTGIQLPTVNGTVTIGGSGNLWSYTWSAALISTTTFGVLVQAINSDSSTVATWYIAAVSMSMWATGGPAITVLSGSGSFSAVTGYQYVVAYGNSNSGHVSTATPPSAGTGVFTNRAGVQVSLVASADPQVNQIWVFRTTDGGSTFLNLPTSPYPNTTANIVDDSPDTSLVVTQAAPIDDANDPPPAGFVKMCYHLNRIWGAVGNAVYYSGGPDVLLGNGSESFPPLNSFTFPTQVNRLVPTSTVLLVFTASGSYYIAGTSTATFYAMPLWDGLGLLSYNALATEGNNTWVYSADKQFIRMSSAGTNEDGYSIGNLLEATYDPSSVYVASLINGTSDKAVFLGDGESTWYRDCWNQPPEGGPGWSPQAVITNGYTALGSVEVSPGFRQLLVGQSNGLGQYVVSARSLNTFTDLGTPYLASAVIGSFVLAQPNQLADVESITLQLPNIGTIPTLDVMLDEVFMPFANSPGITNANLFENLPNSVDDPPILTTSQSVMSKRFYLLQGGDPIQCQYMTVRVSFIAEPIRNELQTLAIYGALEGNNG